MFLSDTAIALADAGIALGALAVFAGLRHSTRPNSTPAPTPTTTPDIPVGYKHHSDPTPEKIRLPHIQHVMNGEHVSQQEFEAHHAALAEEKSPAKRTLVARTLAQVARWYWN